MSNSCKRVQVAAHDFSRTQASDEVQVYDPTHPLYGRRFRVHSFEKGDAGRDRRHVLVWYENEALLRLPLRALTRAEHDAGSVTKLTTDSITELVDRAWSFGLLVRGGNKILLVFVVFVGLLFARPSARAGSLPETPVVTLAAGELSSRWVQESARLRGVTRRVMLKITEVTGCPGGEWHSRPTAGSRFTGSAARRPDSRPAYRSSAGLVLPGARCAAGRDRRPDHRRSGGAR